jgi:hypothetical protein
VVLRSSEAYKRRELQEGKGEDEEQKLSLSRLKDLNHYQFHKVLIITHLIN